MTLILSSIILILSSFYEDSSLKEENMRTKPHAIAWFFGFFSLTAIYCANVPIPIFDIDDEVQDLFVLNDFASQPDLSIVPDMTPPNGPDGFKPVLWEDKNGNIYKGVILYKKDYEGGSPDYVWAVDLEQGAKLQSFVNPIAPKPYDTDGPGPFPMIGPNPNFTKRDLNEALWSETRIIRPKMIAIMNGSFFDNTRPYSPAPFTIKQDGIVVSAGNNMLAEYKQAGYIRLLRVDHAGARADVVDFNKDPTAYQNQLKGYDTVIGGLAKDAAKLNPFGFTGRTMVGANGSKAYIFNSAFSRCVKDPMKTDDGGAEILEKFGAKPDQVINMDGGSSARMIGVDREGVLITYVSRTQNGPLSFYLSVSSGN